ncbi:MAG TPA: hypothetical protein VIK48_00770 [Candidatus Manganitrophaceae bacterium]
MASLPKRGVLSLLAFLLLVSCKTTPVTERSQLILIPESQEIALGLTAYQEILSKLKLSDDAEKTAMLRRVGERVAADYKSQKVKTDTKDHYKPGWGWVHFALSRWAHFA